MSKFKTPGSVWYMNGVLVEIVEWNGCLVRVREADPARKPFLVDPERLTIPTADQFEFAGACWAD